MAVSLTDTVDKTECKQYQYHKMKKVEKDLYCVYYSVMYIVSIKTLKMISTS